VALAGQFAAQAPRAGSISRAADSTVRAGRLRVRVLGTRRFDALAGDAARALRGDAQRNEVVVPGYTCFSVPASIERAGLRVRVCDIDPQTLSYDAARLADFDFSRVLAIVSANLYGLPNDLGAIEAIARRHGVYMVDDAAQALGATCAGRPVGTFGDVGLFSLDKGKNITSMQGGILVTRDAEIAAALHRRVAALPGPGVADTLVQVLKLFAYALLLPPTRYGITRRLPFLGLGRTPYHAPSPLNRYSPALGAFAALLYARLDQLGAERRANARRVSAAIAAVAGIQPLALVPETEPVFVRLPVLAADAQARQALLGALDAAGIGATGSYPAAIVDIPELRGRLDPATSIARARARWPPGSSPCPRTRSCGRLTSRRSLQRLVPPSRQRPAGVQETKIYCRADVPKIRGSLLHAVGLSGACAAGRRR
jgi:perosamine synthetase